MIDDARPPLKQRVVIVGGTGGMGILGGKLLGSWSCAHHPGPRAAKHPWQGR